MLTAAMEMDVINFRENNLRVRKRGVLRQIPEELQHFKGHTQHTQNGQPEVEGKSETLGVRETK